MVHTQHYRKQILQGHLQVRAVLFVAAVILSMARVVDRLIAPIQARSLAATISVFDLLSLLSFYLVES
jgi:hypothetical protein